ncbi:MAG: glycosyltransferase family 4 protein [Anaerolineales bacterium]|nr:glycosyltransferase family 4 protein [Chloroflexota bacterium]MBL6980227.1 glycosyltransferase family 4 protein [Anaerolineales bacterium]
MRILVVIYEFPPVGGGGGRVAEDICRGLVRRGHDVRILTSHLKGLPKYENQDGIEILRVPVGRRTPFKAGFIDMLGYIILGFLPGMRLIARWKPDLMHVHFAVPSGALAKLLSMVTGVPYLLTAHLGDVPGGVPDKTDRWFRWVFPFTPPIWKSAAKVCAVSEFTQQLAKESYSVNAQMIPNGVDLAMLNPGEITVGEPPRIIFAGRFVSQKNPLQIVRTLAQLADLPWNCVMVGDGPLRPEIEAEIERHGLNDRFTLTGWVSPDDVIEWFRKSDILFMPSLSEGLPVVGVQALAMGLAVVASRIGGFIELVEPDQNGYLLDGYDDAMGVEELRMLISSPERLGEFRRTSRQLASRFDVEHIVDSYEGELQSVIDSLKASETEN